MTKKDYKFILKTIFNDKGRFFNFLRNLILNINKKYLYNNKNFNYKINFQKGKNSKECIKEKVENFLCLYVNIKEIDKKKYDEEENDYDNNEDDKEELNNDIKKDDDNNNDNNLSDNVNINNNIKDNEINVNNNVKNDNNNENVKDSDNKEDVNDAFEIKFDSNNPIVKEFDIEIKMEYIDIKKSNKNVKLLLKK